MVTKTLPAQAISQELDVITFKYNLLLSLHEIKLAKTHSTNLCYKLKFDNGLGRSLLHHKPNNSCRWIIYPIYYITVSLTIFCGIHSG